MSEVTYTISLPLLAAVTQCNLPEDLHKQLTSLKPNIDSLPKSEPVAWIVQGTEENILGELTHQRDVDYYQWDIEELPVGTKLYTQPALSKEDMVKVLEALEVGPNVLHTLPKNEACKCSQCDFVRLRKEAITIMQSAIGVMK